MIRRVNAWWLGAGLVAAASLVAGCGAAPETDEASEQTASVEADCKTQVAFDKTYGRIVKTRTFEGADGKPVRYREYRHLGRDKAVVVFLNGRAEFIEKYDVLFTSLHEHPEEPTPDKTFADLPVTFVTMDHEGQGAAMEGRVAGHIDDFDNFVQNVGTLFEKVPSLRRHRAPVYLVSHSMGGLVAARFAQLNPDKVDGLVLSSPMLGIAPPPGVTPEQLQLFGQLYASPAPYGLGLDKLCTNPTQVPQEALIGIAGCHMDPTLTACLYDPSGAMCPYLTQCLFMGLPNDCGAPPIDFAGLNAVLQILPQLPEGCQTKPPACDTLVPSLTTDDAYCSYAEGHPLHAPESTFGWLNQAMIAQGELYGGAAIDMPTLILSNTNDNVVDASKHVCAAPFGADCELVTYTDRGHELLTGLERADAIGEIRAFLADQAGF